MEGQILELRFDEEEEGRWRVATGGVGGGAACRDATRTKAFVGAGSTGQ